MFIKEKASHYSPLHFHFHSHIYYTTMFLVKLTEFEPLLDSTSYLAQYSNDNADIKFAPGKLFLIVPNRSPRFFATLQLSPRWFSNYSVDHVHSSKVSLESFHDAILDGGSFASMTIHLLDKTNQMILRFDTPSSKYIFLLNLLICFQNYMMLYSCHFLINILDYYFLMYILWEQLPCYIIIILIVLWEIFLLIFNFFII